MSLKIITLPICLFAPGIKSKFKINRKKKLTLHSKNKKEIPIYASFKKASYTIEATVIMPLFITLMLFGIFTFRVLQVQSGVQQGINQASRIMAVTLGNIANSGESDQDVDMSEEEVSIFSMVPKAGLYGATLALSEYEIAKTNLPSEFIDGGLFGINYLETNTDGNYIDVKVSYRMTFPIGLLGKYSFNVTQRARNRKWVGYDKSENNTDGAYVYITEHGKVYHTNYYCTYLNPSVHRVSADEISKKRNKSGGIYYECKKCKHSKNTGFLYITDYGTAYHSDMNCTEIKHMIKQVPLSSVEDTMSPCSKCAAGHRE